MKSFFHTMYSSKKTVTHLSEPRKDFISLFLIICTTILLTRTLMVIPLPWPDEPIMYESAANLFSKGVAATSLYHESYPELTDHSITYPPLYFLVLGSWIQLFGDSFIILRLSSVAIGICALISFYYLLRTITKSAGYALLATFILSINYDFIRSSHLLRMEILLLASLLLGLYLYSRSQTLKSKIFSLIPLSLSPLIHLVGVTGLILGAISVVFDKYKLKTKINLVFFLCGMFVIATGIWLVAVRDDFQVLHDQFLLHMVRKSEVENHLHTLLKIPEYIFIFSSIITLLITFGFLLLINKEFRSHTKYFLITLTSVVITISSKEMWYVLIPQPFFILLAIIITQFGFRHRLLYGFASAVAFLIIPMYLNAQVIMRDYHEVKDFSYLQFVNQIQSQIPPESSLCLSALPDPYFGLRHTDLYLQEFLYTSDLKNRLPNLLSKCNYIIYNIDYSSQIWDALGKNFDNPQTLQVTPLRSVQLIKVRSNNVQVPTQVSQ